MRALCPSYKTIADFRQRNAKALRQVHAQFVALCRELNLLGGKRVAADSSNVRGSYHMQLFSRDNSANSNNT